MTLPLSTQQARANEWAYEHIQNMLEASTHFLHRDLLTLANMRLAWKIRPSTEANRATYNRVWGNMNARYSFIKNTITPPQQAKYERLMKELNAGVALHLCRNDRFPKGYTGNSI